MEKNLVIVLLSVLTMSLIVSAADCTPSWKCTDWSPCSNGKQIRSCVDFNNCGNLTGKPAESQTCSDCIPSWSCTEWVPLKCPKEGRQERSCVDSNDCNKLTGMPLTTKGCTPEKSLGWIFFLIIGVVILLIILDLILIKKRWRNIEIMENKNKVFKRELPAKSGMPSQPL